jgi:hypothetical protein
METYDVWYIVHHCFRWGREIAELGKSLAILVVEAHSGRIGSARLGVIRDQKTP